MAEVTLTQHQKILTLMCRHRAQEWWLPHHFMTNNLGTLFVGYEAGARIAELGKRYPQMMQSLPEGKYKKRRIRFESMHQWLHLLPTDLQSIFKKEVATDTKLVNKPDPHNHRGVWSQQQVAKPVQPAEQQSLVDVPVKPPRRDYH